MSGINFAGEFELKELKILASSGNIIDVKKAVQAIEIFEDLMSPCLTGTITVIDIDNMLENAPIIGQEYMSLKISTPSLDKDAFDFSENVFSIYKILSKENAANDAQIFTLSFCSPELLKNNRVRISKHYLSPIDEMVESIMKDGRFIDTRKDLFLEETSGNRSIISPNLRPFDFINMIKQEAVSKKYNAPHFFFFENKRGIHFKSLQSMYEAGTVADLNTGDIQNFDKNKTPDPEVEFKRVLDFQVNSNNDMLLNIRGGMLGSKVTEYNYFNKTFNVSDFRYFDNFSDFPRINENPIYNNTMIDENDNNIGSFSDAKIHLHPTSRKGKYDASVTTPDNDYAYTPNSISSSLSNRQSKMLELNYGINVSMKITGNTTISVGDMINIQVPVTGRTHNKEFDEYLSGDYLITKLRHMFSQVDKKHEIAMNACKDSLPAEYPINQSSIEPKAIKGQVFNVTY